MINKRYFLLAGIFAFIGLVGISCSVNGEDYPIVTLTPAPVTQTPVATQPPTDIPTQTALPTIASFGSTYPTPIPYPTASAVKSNAVAFIAENALWVANVDGSGEKKLVDIIYDNDSYYPQVVIQWAPDGKWISYISEGKLWMISRDGSTKKSLLLLPDKSVANLIRYAWSPDSSKIAYLELSYSKPTITPTPRPQGGDGIAIYLVGIIDVATGNVSEIPLFVANAGIPVLSWSPDGHDLLFIKDYSLVLFDVAANKIVKTIKRGCGVERGLSWSPNGKWLSYTDNGVGGFNPTWICVNSATGDSIQTIDVDSTSFNPIWDKTGNYLYFLAAKIDLTRKSNPLIDERLMRYDVKTQKTESLLSLKELQQLNGYNYRQFLSISPDGNTLMLQSESSQTKFDLIFVDIQSLTTTKSTIDFRSLPNNSYPHIETCGWSPDNQNIIFYFYRRLYAFDSQTSNVIAITGDHAGSCTISPIATTP
jgi:Tol biopolymer transport system component